MPEVSHPVFGADFTKIRERIGVVLQNVEYQILAPTVWEDISFSPRNYGMPSEEVARLTDAVMETLRITRLRDRVPHYLLAGEKRRESNFVTHSLDSDPESSRSSESRYGASFASE